MDAVTRTWLGFAALGAGLVHFALAVGSPVSVAIGFIVIGAAEFAWGVFAFTTDHLPLPWLARAGALIPVVLWALALVTGLDFADTVRVFPMLAASALDLVIAIGVTLIMRRAAARQVDDAETEQAPSRQLRPPAYLAAMFAGALVVGAVTTPALAATEAGEYASHGGTGTTPGVEFPTDGHGH